MSGSRGWTRLLLVTLLRRCRSTTMPCKMRRPTTSTHSASGHSAGSAPPDLMLQALPLPATAGKASLTTPTPWRGHSYPTARARAAALASHWPSWRCKPVANLPFLTHVRLCSPTHAECQRRGRSAVVEIQAISIGADDKLGVLCTMYCCIVSLSSELHADSHSAGDGAGSLQGNLG